MQLEITFFEKRQLEILGVFEIFSLISIGKSIEKYSKCQVITSSFVEIWRSV